MKDPTGRLQLPLRSHHPRLGSAVARSAASATNIAPPDLCQARITPACRERGGRFEDGRRIRKNTRYCHDCRRQRQRDQIALWKRNKRQEVGGRVYRDELCFPSPEHRRQYQRIYMQARRAWQQLDRPTDADRAWLEFLYARQVHEGYFRKRIPATHPSPAAA